MVVLWKSTGNATLDEMAAVSGAATPRLVMEWAILLGVAFVFSCLRTYARVKVNGIRGLGWDDYLGWVAYLFYTALSVNGKWFLSWATHGHMFAHTYLQSISLVACLRASRVMASRTTDALPWPWIRVGRSSGCEDSAPWPKW